MSQGGSENPEIDYINKGRDQMISSIERKSGIRFSLPEGAKNVFGEHGVLFRDVLILHAGRPLLSGKDVTDQFEMYDKGLTAIEEVYKGNLFIQGDYRGKLNLAGLPTVLTAASNLNSRHPRLVKSIAYVENPILLSVGHLMKRLRRNADVVTEEGLLYDGSAAMDAIDALQKGTIKTKPEVITQADIES